MLDGIGSTEMLHIFISGRPGRTRAGATGEIVAGYEAKIVDDEGQPVPDGTPGHLYVKGSSAATGYWSRTAVTRRVFQGEWVRTGDTYVRDEDGYYACLGRTGDMLKASGIWVSPAEVETRLLAHDAVAQAVVVAGNDPDGLEKPVAFVVLSAGASATEEELVAFCRDALPAFKRPRRVIFVDAYPTTATGKIRRVELRETASDVLRTEEPVAS
jgi:acyl-coenzyme A synthetase/AMP-(fatty) acid ligase